MDGGEQVLTELTADQVRWRCEPADLGFQTTTTLQPLATIVGQARAVDALQFGLNIADHGFNIYVAGPPGTGKTTAVKTFLEEKAKDMPRPDDWCYVHNFADSYRPWALRLPAGRGRQLKQDMEMLITRIKQEIRRAFESDEYSTLRQEVTAQYQGRQEALFNRLGKRAKEAGFVVQGTPTGFLIIPLTEEGKPMTEEQFRELPEEVRKAIQQRRERVEEELREVVSEVRKLQKEAAERLEEVDRQVALYAIGHLFDELLNRYQGIDRVNEYLNAVREDVLANIDQFRTEPSVPAQMPFLAPIIQMQAFRKYEVNVVVDNAETEGAPV
ncbi:MAG TPA: ATP-dependent protease, partial [Anaerolineae bacterium]|nr:ATP-dependent protease [Anaerolineae bacterium]